MKIRLSKLLNYNYIYYVVSLILPLMIHIRSRNNSMKILMKRFPKSQATQSLINSLINVQKDNKVKVSSMYI